MGARDPLHVTHCGADPRQGDQREPHMVGVLGVQHELERRGRLRRRPMALEHLAEQQRGHGDDLGLAGRDGAPVRVDGSVEVLLRLAFAAPMDPPSVG